VGRLVTQKNLTTLFKAFALVHEKMPKSFLVIAGDGPLRVGLKRIAKRLNIENRILWLGNLRLHSLRAWYAAARATMLPSFHEGFGKVIVESYLMGTPVMATPFVSAHELIRDGETGFINPRFTDHRWLAEKALDLISHPSQAKDMGQRGREHIRGYLLHEDQYLERLTNIWRVTAQSRRTATPHRDSQTA
jgi:glycosyltransferase involved in cell wall biosynthesis